MKNYRITLLSVCIGLLALAPLAFAHHGTANYDTSRQITVKGTVSGFEFVNPHVQIYWEAKDDAGVSSKWQGELTSPNRLSRAGWTKSTLKPGDSVVVTGFPTKSGSHEIWIQKVLGSDGQELSTGGGGN
jgi:Family of unknown function (DUF6152)